MISACRLFLLLFIASCAHSIVVRFDLPDEIVANTFLGNLTSRSAELAQRLSRSPGSYRIIREPNSFADNHFQLNDSGLSTKSNLDRDELCMQLACCKLRECATNFTIFIRLRDSTIRVVVVLQFHDENDNKPVISAGVIKLPESTPVGTVKALPLATDKDSAPNGVVSYRLFDETHTFELSMVQRRPMLKLLKKLDADDTHLKNYALVYSAIDSGRPSRTGQVTLTVDVVDENDNAPIFKVSSRTVDIRENYPVGHKIYNFEASDLDVDRDNRRISYRLDRLHSTPKDVAEQRFVVNSNSGAVTIRSQLDYDKPSERHFKLVVIAMDHGSPQLSASSSLIVNLKNVNDNPPQISVTHILPLLEEEPKGQRVRTISVRDPDEPSNSNVNCSLKSSDGFEIKPITENYYFDIITTRVFDYEFTKEMTIIIGCTDRNPPVRTVFKTLNIPVVDINDHSPLFLPVSYADSLAENTPLGREVLVVRATDKDSGRRGEVRYSLDKNGARYFKIDKMRGIMYVNATLDREENSSLLFYVWATDGGSPPRRASAAVRIDLTDVNDNMPALVGPKTIAIYESTSVGTVIARIKFRDPDEGRNGIVDYHLIRDNNLALKFLNVTDKGDVIIIAPLDREANGQMFLNFAVQDRGSPVMKTHLSLIVKVLDVNDNTPRLVSPMNQSTVGDSPALYADSAFNSTVAQLKAVDGDLEENGSISFHVVRTNATDLFQLHPSTGRLATAWRYPSQPNAGFYYIKIRISDAGMPPKFSDVLIYVSVAPSIGMGALGGQGVSNIIILILILAVSIAIVTALVIAILWARSRSKRPLTVIERAEYLEYDTSLKKARPPGLVPDVDPDPDAFSNTELVPRVPLNSGEHLGQSEDTSSLTASQKLPPGMNPHADYVIPYPVATVRNCRSPVNFENIVAGQFRTFGHQSSPGQTFPMENFATIGRSTRIAPPAYQQRPTAVVNAHLLPEMYEEDQRQSELSYEDSGKGGSVDDVARPGGSTSGVGHHAPTIRLTPRSTMRGVPGGTPSAKGTLF